MKKILILSLAVLFLYSCKNTKKVEEPAAQATELAHNAKNSLDVAGTYKGTLPMDGKDKEVSITLADSTFTKTIVCCSKEEPTEEKGAFTWNSEGNSITLEGVTAPNKYFVGENTLTQLDAEGNKITGDEADKYILKK